MTEFFSPPLQLADVTLDATLGKPELAPEPDSEGELDRPPMGS